MTSVPSLPRGERERLPDRRDNVTTQKIVVNGKSVFIGIGRYNDGRIAELWLDVSREGDMMRTIFGSLAASVSIGLQFGVPLQEYIDRFKGDDFEPRGRVEGDDFVKEAKSISDAVFQILEREAQR